MDYAGTDITMFSEQADQSSDEISRYSPKIFYIGVLIPEWTSLWQFEHNKMHLSISFRILSQLRV